MTWVLYLVTLITGVVVGYITWWIVAFQAISCFIFGIPTAFRLRWRGILASWIPAVKYMLRGVVFSAIGYVLFAGLWGLWHEGFDAGLLVGFSIGVYYSSGRFSGVGNWKSFVTENSQYVDENAAEKTLENL